MKKGQERIMLPLIRKGIFVNGTELYQPMFPIRSHGQYNPMYENKYVKERSIDFDNGIGRVFVYPDKKLSFYKEQYDWLPKEYHDHYQLAKDFSKQVYITQIDNLSTMGSDKYLSEKKKKEIKKLKRLSIANCKAIIKLIENDIF